MAELFQQIRVINPLARELQESREQAGLEQAALEQAALDQAPELPADAIADVLIEDGVLQAIAPQLSPPPGATVQSGKGLVLGPGLVDLYSQSGEPGFEERETLDSLTQAALAGGFTRLTLLPNTLPALDHPAALMPLQQYASPVRFNLWGAMTQAAAGQQMTELAELAAAGIVGFADGHPLNNWVLVRRLLEYVQPLQLPVALWPCDRQLTGQGVVREGSIALNLGLPGVPDMAETAALAALIECVREVGTPVHLMRISTARSIDLLQRAKAEGIPITASVSWLHLLFDAQDLANYDPNLRLEPPLGNPWDRKALAEAVQAGVIDAIAIDHHPFTYEEKTVAFGLAPAGSIGLELALPLLWQRFVASGSWSAPELWQRLSTAPSRCLQQSPPSLTQGAATELVLFDPQLRWSVTAAQLKSKALNTPWFGQEISGKVLQTYTPGKT